MKDLFIDTEFGSVFAKSAGERSNPLVLGIHGWSQRNGWHTWEPLMAPLVAAGFWVVSVDMPGWGQSVPANPEPIRGSRAVEDVLAILDGLQAENESESAVLMGKSWGGGLALSLALAHPQRVSKLILTAPAFHDLDRLTELRQPVLLAWARDDTVIPYERSVEFVGTIPNVQLESYRSGGHDAAPHNAEYFAPKAVNFLRD